MAGKFHLGKAQMVFHQVNGVGLPEEEQWDGALEWDGEHGLGAQHNSSPKPSAAPVGKAAGILELSGGLRARIPGQ